MKINNSKTLVPKKDQRRQECIKINEENIQGVKEFCYLESKIMWNGRSKKKKKKIKSRIAQAKTGINLKLKFYVSQQK